MQWAQVATREMRCEEFCPVRVDKQGTGGWRSGGISILGFRTQLEFPEHPELINNPAVGKGLDQRPPEAPSNLKRLVIIRHVNICVCKWCCRQTPRGDLYMI